MDKHSAKVHKVLTLMGESGVSLLDLETYGYVETLAEGTDGLTVSVDEAFDRLVEDEFNYWADSRDAEYWYDAGRDMVYDALNERGLFKEEE